MNTAPSPAAPSSSLVQCPNCNAPLQGEFCYACGQPRKGLIRHFSGIVGDFLDSVLNFDSRTFRTLIPLFLRPGFLSIEYFAGRRVRYVTPLRLYFFLSVIAFLAVSMVTEVGGPGEAVAIRSETPTDPDAAVAAAEPGLAALPPEQAARLREQIRAAAEAQRQAEIDGAALARQSDAAEGTDGAEEPMRITFGDGGPWHKTENPLRFAWLSDDLNRALNEEIEVLLRKARGIGKDPAPFVRQIYAVAPQALFLILPLFALLLKGVYLFKRRLYMEHLIVALHSHSFICFSLILGVLIGGLREWSAGLPVLPSLLRAAGAALWIWLPLYLLLMQKRVYRQGWILTVLKFGVVGTLYVVLLSLGMVATVLASLILL